MSFVMDIHKDISIPNDDFEVGGHFILTTQSVQKSRLFEGCIGVTLLGCYYCIEVH